MKRHWVLCTPDVLPISKSGGIADYVWSFAQAVGNAGYAVEIYSPYYEHLMLDRARAVTWKGKKLTLEFQKKSVEFEVLETLIEGVVFRTIRCPEIFKQKSFYEKSGVFNVNVSVYSFLCKAMIADLVDRRDEYRNSKMILQGNDVFASFFAVYLDRSNFPAVDIKTLLCLHNVGENYIGRKTPFDFRFMDDELRTKLSSWEARVDYWLEALIPFFDKIFTVSRTHALEIADGEHQLHRALRTRMEQGDFDGFINGIDEEYWSIRTTPFLERSSSVSIEETKCELKNEICREYGFDAELPLFLFVGRIREQKGLELFNELVESVPEVQLLLLGEGDSLGQYLNENTLNAVVHEHRYSDALCHRLFAAADFLIVPSHYEPCGLVAMYATRFATLPLVHSTGGLIEIAQTVFDATQKSCSFQDVQELSKLVRSECENFDSISEIRPALSSIRWSWSETILKLEQFIFRTNEDQNKEKIYDRIAYSASSKN